VRNGSRPCRKDITLGFDRFSPCRDPQTSMLLLLRSLLRVLHFFYHIFTLIASWKSQPHPHELSYPRKQTPRHLALLLVSDGNESASVDTVLDCYLESVQRIVGWCQAVGIRKLTTYDRDGTAIRIHSCFAQATNMNS
jgi:dehydrodolichyl diphosphate syntase complex subunit NUS1